MSKLKFTSLCVLACMVFGYVVSCNKADTITAENIVFKAKLSEYNIYTGVAGSLVHQLDYTPYQLATALFSDYSEKQRLIKLPPSTKLMAEGDGLPGFPDGTIIVKTFYYFRNKSDTSLGKKIIETRLLIKSEGKWNAATYLWNTEQTDAVLVSSGVDLPMNWINERGEPMVISYRVPSKKECGTCHQASQQLTPIGPKLRNLNVDMEFNGAQINQLDRLVQQGLLEPVNPAALSRLPDWTNRAYSLEQRARAYLDVNCGHCHNDNGFAKRSRLTLTFHTSLDNTGISSRKREIDVLMSRGAMPLIGTTLVHKEGLALVQEFLNTLH